MMKAACTFAAAFIMFYTRASRQQVFPPTQILLLATTNHCFPVTLYLPLHLGTMYYRLFCIDGRPVGDLDFMAFWHRKLSLEKKVLMVVLAAVIIPTGVVAAILISYGRTAARAEYFTIAHSTSESVADRIRDFTESAMAVLSGAGLDPALSQPDSIRKEYLDALLARFDYFEGLFIDDSSGLVFVHKKSLPQYISWRGQIDDTYRAYTSGRIYVSDVLYFSQGKSVVLVAAPIMKPAGARGVVGGIVSLDAVNRIVSRVNAGIGSKAFVVDAHRRIVAYPANAVQVVGLTLPLYPLIQEAFSGRPDTSFTSDDIFTDPLGNRVVGTYRYLPDLRWSVIVEQPIGSVFGFGYRRIGVVLLYTLIFAVLFSIIGFRLARVITVPLLRLAEDAKILGSGNLHHRIHLGTDDELEELGETLNEMAANLDRSRMQLEEEHDRAMSAAREARTLYRISQALVSTMDLRQRLEVVAESLTAICRTNKVMIWLIESNRLIPYADYGLSYEEAEYFQSLERPIDEADNLTRESLTERRIIAVYDTAIDRRLPRDMIDRLGLKSVMTLPFVFEEKVTGYAITYEKRVSRRFTKYQLNLVEAIVAQAAAAIENARAYERERHIAETLQRCFLPTIPRQIGDFELADLYAPAWSEAEIGGDFYDVVDISPTKIGLVIADVSGKGLDAAVHTALIKYVLRAYSIRFARVEKMIGELNNAVYKFIGEQAFVTLFFGVLDIDARTLTYVNAGHELPLLFGDERKVCMQLETTGTALGIIENFEYQSRSIEFQPGDSILLYTDGATEARHGMDFLGIEGLEEIFCEIAPRGADDIVQTINRKIRDFSEGELHDDVALLVVKYDKEQ